jgi:hypothetical protein
MYSDYNGVIVPGDNACSLANDLQDIVTRMEPSRERDQLLKAVAILVSYFCGPA